LLLHISISVSLGKKDFHHIAPQHPPQKSQANQPFTNQTTNTAKKEINTIKHNASVLATATTSYTSIIASVANYLQTTSVIHTHTHISR
jgi:hypothetical protein